MEEMLARVAALEKKIATDHCKKVFEISCNVALQRLESSEKDIKWRLERIVSLAARRCNDTIERNGVSSKLQCDEIKDLVSKLEKRLDSQSKGVANMEAGLKQLQHLESRLIQVIRRDQHDTIARLEELEESSTILAAATADIKACLEAKTSTILAKVTTDIEASLEAKVSKIMNEVTTDIDASLEAKVSTIMEKVSTSMAACLGTAKSKEMSGEAQKGSNAKPVPVRELPPPDLLSSSLRCPRGLRSSRIGDHALQMAFGRDILRRSREQQRGRASSVHEMIQAAQGEAYTRVVAARRSASLQPALS